MSQWVAWKIRVPAILFLLAGGILLGPLTGWLNPDELFGDLLFPFISLSERIPSFSPPADLRTVASAASTIPERARYPLSTFGTSTKCEALPSRPFPGSPSTRRIWYAPAFFTGTRIRKAIPFLKTFSYVSSLTLSFHRLSVEST